MEITSSLLNRKEFALAKQSIIDVSSKDNNGEFRVDTIEYINDSSSNSQDMFFFDMLEFSRFLQPDDEAVAYTTPDHLIWLNCPGHIGKNLRHWDFIYDHECLHQLWETFKVADEIKNAGYEYDHQLLNIASDCVINDYLSFYRKKDSPSGLITPKLLKDQFGVVYDRLKDTQFTLYLKLLNVKKELQNKLKEEFGDQFGEGQQSQGEGQQSQSGKGQQGQGQGGSSQQKGQGQSSSQQQGQSGEGGGDKRGDSEGQGSSQGSNNSGNSNKNESAEAAAERAQKAADKAKKAAEEAAKNGDKDAAGKKDAAERAKDAADKAKEAAKKAAAARKNGQKGEEDKQTDAARNAADTAEISANRAEAKDNNNTSPDDDYEQTGKTIKSNGSGHSSKDVVIKGDIEIKEKAEKIIEKYSKKIAGDFGKFISKCKSSVTLKKSGLSTGAVSAANSWKDKLEYNVNAYVKKKVFQKKREWEQTYSRVKRGSGYIKYGEPINPGRRIRQQKMTIDVAFYLDRSGSMYNCIDNVVKSCKNIAEGLKKRFGKDEVVDSVTFKTYAFNERMVEVPFGKKISADGGNMSLQEMFNFIKKNTNTYLINIIITDGQYDVDKSKVNSFLKDIDGMFIFVTNVPNSTVRNIAKENETKMFYIEADEEFKI